MPATAAAEPGDEAEAAAAAVVAAALARDPVNVDLSGLSLRGAAAGRAIAAALRTLPPKAVRSLNLRGNTLGPSGTEAVADALAHAPCIARLDLGGNDVGDLGAAALARVLPRLRALEELDLWGNGIGARGARKLAHAICITRSLRAFALGGNPLTIAAKEEFAAVLAEEPPMALTSLRCSPDEKSFLELKRYTGAMGLPRRFMYVRNGVILDYLRSLHMQAQPKDSWEVFHFRCPDAC